MSITMICICRLPADTRKNGRDDESRLGRGCLFEGFIAARLRTRIVTLTIADRPRGAYWQEAPPPCSISLYQCYMYFEKTSRKIFTIWSDLLA